MGGRIKPVLGYLAGYLLATVIRKLLELQGKQENGNSWLVGSQNRHQAKNGGLGVLGELRALATS